MALLVAWLGDVGASVTLVIISALAGSALALSSHDESRNGKKATAFVLTNLLVSLSLAWGISGVVTSWMPQLASEYLPSTIAFLLSFAGKRLPSLLNSGLNGLMERLKGKVQQ